MQHLTRKSGSHQQEGASARMTVTLAPEKDTQKESPLGFLAVGWQSLTKPGTGTSFLKDVGELQLQLGPSSTVSSSHTRSGAGSAIGGGGAGVGSFVGISARFPQSAATGLEFGL